MEFGKIDNIFNKKTECSISDLKKQIKSEVVLLDQWKRRLEGTCQGILRSIDDDNLEQYLLNTQINIHDIISYINYHSLKIKGLKEMLNVYNSLELGVNEAIVNAFEKLSK